METIRLKTEIYVVKCYQTFHLILIILIVFCHFIAHTKYLFLSNSLLLGFGIGIALYIIIFLYILISNIIICSKKYTPTIINAININIKYIGIICLIKGLILTSVYWLNYNKYAFFMENCPFNFSLEKMNKLISNTDNNNIKRKCLLKRCFFIKEYQIENENSEELISKYSYLCNFNLYNSYLNYIANNEECNYIYNNELNFKESPYSKKCEEYVNYYICPSNKKRHGKYNIKNDFKCPTKYRKHRIIILGVLFPLIDIAADLILILFIHWQYNIIIKLINLEIILGSIYRYSPSSLNSTKENSIIINNRNNENILPRLNQTEIYISQNLLNNNDKEKNNIKNENRINKININNGIGFCETNNDLINSKNDLVNETEEKI